MFINLILNNYKSDIYIVEPKQNIKHFEEQNVNALSADIAGCQSSTHFPLPFMIWLKLVQALSPNYLPLIFLTGENVETTFIHSFIHSFLFVAKI